jgi:DNA polymerase-3 subunit epsilon
MTVKFFAFDTETSSSDPATAEVLSFACMLLTAKLEPIFKVEWFVHPSSPSVVHPDAAKVNGYSHDLWVERGALTVDAFKTALRSMLRSFNVKRAQPLGHFVKFDLDVLSNTCKDEATAEALHQALNYVAIDTASLASVLDHIFEYEYAPYNLSALCERYGVTLTNAHDALADIEATVALYGKITHVMQYHLHPPAPIPASIFEDGKLRVGKYKGVRVEDADRGYLAWALKKMTLRAEDVSLIQATLNEASRKPGGLPPCTPS